MGLVNYITYIISCHEVAMSIAFQMSLYEKRHFIVSTQSGTKAVAHKSSVITEVAKPGLKRNKQILLRQCRMPIERRLN